MRRRKFITLFSIAAAAWPLAARAQQSDRVKHIGVLSVGNFPKLKEYLAAFQRELELARWSEGRNAQIDVRFATPEQAHVRAQELFALQPDVILACTTPAALAVQRASRTIPIIFVAVSDPIGAWSGSKPGSAGRNLTGVLSFEDTITGKWLAMLKEIAPSLARAAVLGNPKSIPYDYYLRGAQSAASTLAIELVPTPFETVADIEQAVESFAKSPNGGLLVLPGTTRLTLRAPIIALAARHRLPAVYPFRTFAVDGGLIAYGPDYVDQLRRAAGYVDRILKGEKPADLPVQAPTKFELVINLKTAKALGLAVPPSLLATANEVIE
jgi:putative ABC transport system substrate-binding protein